MGRLKMDKQIEIKGSLLARNTLLNFLGQAVPLLVGVITIPFIVRGLGTERFGLLSLAWVILGYFTIFDLGLGRATTKFVAEALGKGEQEEIPRLVWTAVTVQAILGIIGGLVLATITPLLVERVLNIPLELIMEAKTIFYLFAFSIPVVLSSGSFRSVLEAFQRFDLVNAINVPSSALTFLLPLVGLWLGFSLTGIVALILLARVGALIAFILMNLRFIPGLRRYSGSFSLFPRLLSFGGWVMVSGIVGPFLRYLDRFMIGVLLSISAVAYYSVPFDILERLWIIPSSLVLALFPAFSTLGGLGRNEETQKLFLRSLKYLAILTTPLIFILIVFAETILRAWLGIEFAKNSTLVLQILAIGVLIGILAPISGSLLQGYGRPDIIAKLYLMYIPINVALVWLLIKGMGLAGAALSFTIRALLETALLIFIAARFVQIPLISLLWKFRLQLSIAIICAIGILLWLLVWSNNPLTLRLVFTCSVLAVFVFIAWRWILNYEDKIALLSFLSKRKQ